MISNLCHQKSVKKVKKCKKVKVKAFFLVGWSNRWRLPSLLDRRSQKSRLSLIEPWFGGLLRLSLGKNSSAIFLSGNAFLRNIRKHAKKKKEGKKSLEDLAASVSPVIRKVRCQASKKGLRWSQNSNYSNRKQCSAYKGRKIEWLALFFFEESNLECWEKRKAKVTENCVENTDFAFAATARPGHMPRQLPARLSGIRSIQFNIRYLGPERSGLTHW